MAEASKTEYGLYLSAFVTYLGGGDYAGTGHNDDDRLALAVALGAADGTQARQMAGQAGMPGLDTHLRGKADVSREIERRLVEARPRT